MATEVTVTPASVPVNPVEPQYFDWEPQGAPLAIHMNRGAMDAIAREVIEGFGTLPRRSLEVGGLLLGRAMGGPRPAVWIEQYQRISCEHRFGPQFILDDQDMAALEGAAARILDSKTAVVGIYRSHARSGFQLEESDLDLIRRYFSDPSDLVLLIRAENADQLMGQFFAWDPLGGVRAAGDEFPFKAHPDADRPAADRHAADCPAADNAAPEEAPVMAGFARQGALKPEAQPQEPDTEITSRKKEIPVFRETPQKPVAGVDPAPVEPAPSLFGLTGNPNLPRWEPPPDEEEPGFGQRLKKWWPAAAALALLGGIAWLMMHPEAAQSLSLKSATPQTTAAASVRPIGLYVDTSAPVWRITWNPNATALHDAHSVQLFVREGDDQNRIDLSPRDLASGSYQYAPIGNDVTFRLEVVDHAGQLSAESFRMMRTSPQIPLAPTTHGSTATAPTPPQAEPKPAEPVPSTTGRITPAKPIYRAPPVVAAGIRPRINGTIGIDVRVGIDARGHVTWAHPVAKATTGLDQYLAGRAVAAAREWRFEPARQNGKAVAGTQTIHFAFEK